MCRFAPFFLAAFTLSAQPPQSPLDKPPQDIDDALHARIKQFYDYHVARKFRMCEPLIAEESQDDFYVLTKPQLDSFKIGPIEYSDHFTKAKVVIIGAMPFLMPMAGPKIVEQPFASYWKQEKGVWVWYYNKKSDNHTPFGDETTPGAKGGDSTAAPGPKNITVEALQSALKIDRTHIELADGKPQIIRVTNTLPGHASLSIDCPLMPIAKTGITATFDKNDLKGNETATLTLNADARVRSGPCPLRIIVSPTNQVLDLTVNVTRWWGASRMAALPSKGRRYRSI